MRKRKFIIILMFSILITACQKDTKSINEKETLTQEETNETATQAPSITITVPPMDETTAYIASPIPTAEAVEETYLNNNLYPDLTGDFHGIAIDKDGNMYIGNDRKDIWKIPPGGNPTLFATVENDMLLNLAVGNDNTLYVLAKTKLYQITNEGEVTLLLEEPDFSEVFGGHNIIFDSEGSLYICYDNKIYKYTQDLEKSIFLDESNEIQFNLIAGMAYDESNNYFYVGDVALNKVVRFTLDAEGKLTQPKEFNIQGAEYIILDSSGNAYVSSYRGLAITKISGDNMETISLSNVSTLNTITFGIDSNSKTIYGTTHNGKVISYSVDH